MFECLNVKHVNNIILIVYSKILIKPAYDKIGVFDHASKNFDFYTIILISEIKYRFIEHKIILPDFFSSFSKTTSSRTVNFYQLSF